MTIVDHPGLSEVLESFMTEASPPNRNTLEQYVASYPQFASELAEFASEWLLLDAVPDAHIFPVDAEAKTQALSVMERLQSHLRKVEALGEEAGKNIGLTNPFANKTATSLKNIAVRLGLDTTLIAKFKNRLIQAETVPQRLLSALAAELEVATLVVSAWLSAPPRLQGARFKADGKPQASQQERFLEAVERSGLTEEQKRHWKD